MEPVSALAPWPREMAASASSVQVTLTPPVLSRSALALTTAGSYSPNASGVVLMLQLALTVALTARFSVAVCACTDTEASKARANAAASRVGEKVLVVIFYLRMCSRWFVQDYRGRNELSPGKLRHR